MKHLTSFETTELYNEATLDLPNVSLIEENMSVYYNHYVPPYNGFCKLILNNDETVELEGSGELTSAIISDYKSTLVSAEIGTLCTSIGNGAFYGCSSLTSIDIPSSVTSIGNDVFKDCSSFASIVVHSTTPPTLGSDTFNNTNNCPIYVPSTSVDTYKSATSWSNYVSRIQAIP